MTNATVFIQDKSLKFENENDNFDSALALHIFENPDHLLLFEEATLISTLNGLPQSFREVIEIKKYINRNFAINRDTGNISLSPIYNSLILKDSINIFPSLVLGNLHCETKYYFKHRASEKVYK